ncbi:MAG: ATP-binding protein [Bacteroidales bacterium]|jgi:signal transduction histidine kinase|nr:ATP-binding protein [Bacteroidales bacterium]
MQKRDTRSLTVAVIVAIVTALVFLFLFLFLGINHRKDVYQDSKKMAKEISRKAAYDTEKYFNVALETARSMEKRALLIREVNGTREQIIDVLKDGLLSNENFLATWTLWEPNAFDRKDSVFITDSLYNNQGTLGLAFFRNNNSVYTETMNEADYTSLYYLPVKELKSDIIVNPYKFRYTGYQQLYFGTTVCIPIIFGDQFLGVIGVDIDFKNLQGKLNNIKLYTSGYLSLISNNGIIVTHNDSAFIAKNIFTLLNGDDSLVTNAIKEGAELTMESISEFSGKKVFRFFYPIKIGEGRASWSMMVEIPVEEATTRSKQLFYIAIGILIVGLSLILYLIFNIIDRKRYEKEILLAKTKSEESDRLKTAFLNNISHEIRTPLNGILGFTELLIESEPGDKLVKEYKVIIHNSSNQLLSIITNVIELAKIQTGQIEKMSKEFEAEKLVTTSLEDFLPEIKAKGLDLIKKLPDSDQSLTIYSDEDKLKQVIKYLVSNAIKFTKYGFIEVGLSKKGNDCLFYVKDTGIGIKSEYHANIFRYFNQEDSSMNRNYGGLGMGLSISKSYIDLLGGSIWFESESGKGSTFYFTVPISRK